MYKCQIDSVISGKSESVEMERLPVNKYISYLNTTTGSTGEWETNGYGVDFWYTIKHEGNTYILEGDLWYEDSVSFYKKKEK